MKKSIEFFSTIILTGMILVSCAGVIEKNTTPKDNLIIENLNSEIILGDKIENLFTVEAVQSRAAEGTKVEANYMYFRCRSNDEEKIKWLSEKFDFMSIVPLDREILEGGTIYKDPELGENECPWYYFMKPVEEFNDVVKQNLIVEILDEMYFDEEDIAILSGEGLEIPEDSYLTVDVNENVSGRWLWQRIKKIIQKYIANRPQGKISVYDTMTKSYSPVKNVLVMSHQLGIFGTSFTDNNGRFSIPLPYTSLGGKVQMIIRFENPNITLTSTEAVSSIFGAVTYYAGSYWIESLSNLDIKFGQNSLNAEFATIMNAMADYRTFCLENHIATPLPLKVFATKYVSGACTPLFRYAGMDIALGLLDTVKLLLGLPVGSIEALLLPDLIISTKSSDGNYTKSIYSLMFHELSHASHYFGLGVVGKETWTQEYFDMASGWIETMVNGKNPMKDDCYNEGGTDLIKLIESWGYFSENYIMNWKFNNTNSAGKSVYLDNLENRYLTGTSKEYFYYGGLYDLIDSDNETNIDFCSGYTYTQLFIALVQPEVSDLYTLSNAITYITNRREDYANVVKTLNANRKI